MDFLKSAAGKVVTGVVAVAVIAAAISWWSLDAGTRQTVLGGAGRILGWALIVTVVPWLGFFLIGKISRLQSNLAGAVLVAALTIGEAVLLGWLFHWQVKGALPAVMYGAAVLVAGAYNLFSCDWIAEKAE